MFVESGNREWRRLGARALVTGQLFRGISQLADAELSTLLDGVDTPEQLSSVVSVLDGFYAIVLFCDDGVCLAVDQVRSIPLFYRVGALGLVVSDSAQAVEDHAGDVEPDWESIAEFAMAGFVTGNRTLRLGIFGTEAGTVTYIDSHDGKSRTIEHAKFAPDCGMQSGYLESSRISKALDDSILSLVDYAQDRQIVVPLSGGYDSRLILSKLVEFKYPKLLAFTYSACDTREALVSEEIARRLGVQWVGLRLDNQTWHEWYTSDARTDYFDRAHNLTSVPHIQDVPAVGLLRETGLVERDAVFAPGHSGDFLAGSHLHPELMNRRLCGITDAVNATLATHYRLWPWRYLMKDQRDILQFRVTCELERELGPSGSALTACETWDWRERQSKYIVNSVRAYEWYGYDWWLPLWTRGFLNAWNDVPLEFRVDQQAYRDMVTTTYAKIAGASQEDAVRNAESPLRTAVKHLLNLIGLQSAARWLRRPARILYMKLHVPGRGWSRLVDPVGLGWWSICSSDFLRHRFWGDASVVSFLVGEFVDLEGLFSQGRAWCKPYRGQK